MHGRRQPSDWGCVNTLVTVYFVCIYSSFLLAFCCCYLALHFLSPHSDLPCTLQSITLGFRVYLAPIPAHVWLVQTFRLSGGKCWHWHPHFARTIVAFTRIMFAVIVIVFVVVMASVCSKLVEIGGCLQQTAAATYFR